MADKFAGGILAGSTSVDVAVLLRVKSDGSELTGKVATAVAAYYWRQSAVSAIEITCATLGSLGAAYSAGGWYEVGSVMPGAYRLCLPNTAISTGAEWVVIGVKDTAGSGFAFYERYALETVHNASLNNLAYADVKSAASAAWSAAAGTNRVFPADGSISAAVLGADCITSAKVGAGALTYDDQITTFKSELSGMAISIPNGHITSAKIGADAIGSDKIAAGAMVYGDQLTGFDADIKSAASAALAAWGKTDFRLSTQGVRDITQYTSAQGGFPGSSAALIDALYWSVAQSGYKRIQTPTTYLVHDAAGNALASAPISGNSAGVTIGIFTNV